MHLSARHRRLNRCTVPRMLAAGAPLKVVLFGSHARGQAHPESDLDLLVIEESTLPRYERAMP